MEYATCSDFPNRLETQDLSLKWTEIKYSCLSHDLDCIFDKIFSVKLHKRFISICITTILSSPSFSDTSYKVWRKKTLTHKKYAKTKIFSNKLYPFIWKNHLCPCVRWPSDTRTPWVSNKLDWEQFFRRDNNVVSQRWIKPMERHHFPQCST